MSEKVTSLPALVASTRNSNPVSVKFFKVHFRFFLFFTSQINTKELRRKFSIIYFLSVSEHLSIQRDTAQISFSVAAFWFVDKHWTVCKKFFLNAKRHSSVDVEFAGCSGDESQCDGYITKYLGKNSNKFVWNLLLATQLLTASSATCEKIH